ncbi:baseplate wedge subunit [Aeromonas phage AS-gz]|uniref:Baseplate wedge subunit n=3 Tax=Tulanevirus TaxID=2560244 RepID=E1A1H6_9CAUD|nr:baseplate wedge subunit [Aeromonas phage phiAS4]YP_009217551.1 baseplate wedge subunit [Stenotrophomonas phage IME13]YP_009613223.1 baseplate wedge subunit [Aeromonas phage AS-gz]ADM79700.1 baseplate wedge subunit [Aeromonas phage phiAS4]AFQ22631.1 baseplate wedge subunit [Stenotrophomonas phage IME13]ASU00772.1 baseplate wedge subunit [Aeromonas phage AS-gz]
MSNFYRAIVTSKFRTKNLLNFYDMVGDEPTKNTIYATFGRDTPWSTNETDVGFAPPYPNDSVDGVVDMWTNMLGAVKINKSLLDAIIPRKDWGDIRYDNPKTFFIDDIVVVNSATYNRTDSSVGWMIYRCVDVPSIGSCSISGIDDKIECITIGGKWTATHESVEPPRGTAMAIDMSDGYVWEYLYTIPPDVSINRCTNEHIVVPFPDELSDDPARWGYENAILWYPDKLDLIYRVKVDTLRFRAYMDSIYFPEASLPGNTGFRQMSVIINPLVKKSLPSDPDVKATLIACKPEELEKDSGEMIYMENRQPITRALDQTEEINIIFSF